MLIFVMVNTNWCTICLFAPPVEKWIQLYSLGIGTSGVLFSNTLQLLLSTQAVQRLTVSLLSKGSFFHQHQKVHIEIKQVMMRNDTCFCWFLCVFGILSREIRTYIVTSHFQHRRVIINLITRFQMALGHPAPLPPNQILLQNEALLPLRISKRM